MNFEFWILNCELWITKALISKHKSTNFFGAYLAIYSPLFLGGAGVRLLPSPITSLRSVTVGSGRSGGAFSFNFYRIIMVKNIKHCIYNNE